MWAPINKPLGILRNNMATYLSVLSIVDVRNISSWSKDNTQYISRVHAAPLLRAGKFLASPIKALE